MSKNKHEVLFNISDELVYIGNSLDVVGNTKLADTMFTMSRQIKEKIQLLIDDEVKADNQRIDDALQSNRSIVDAVFSGIEIGKGK